MDKNDYNKYIGRYPDGRPVPGSALDIAMSMREAEKRKSEKLIDDMSEDFPALKRMYELLKSDSE